MILVYKEERSELFLPTNPQLQKGLVTKCLLHVKLYCVLIVLYFRVIRVTQEPQISNYTTTQINNKPKVVIRPAIAPKAEDNRVQYVRVVSSQPMAQVSIICSSCLVYY